MSYLDIAKRAEAKLKEGLEAAPEPEGPYPESMAAKILAEFEPSEAERIVAAWRDLLGIELDRKRVKDHLLALREWQKRWREMKSVILERPES